MQAQYSLGFMYSDGIGVPENDKTAVKWYTLAAEQGHASAQQNLAQIYSDGHGVPADYVRAYMWFNLASFNDETFGSKNKDIVAQKMTAADIGKAQELSSKCLENDYKDC